MRSAHPPYLRSRYDFFFTMPPLPPQDGLSGSNASGGGGGDHSCLDSQGGSLFGDPVPPVTGFIETLDNHLYGSLRQSIEGILISSDSDAPTGNSNRMSACTESSNHKPSAASQRSFCTDTHTTVHGHAHAHTHKENDSASDQHFDSMISIKTESASSSQNYPQQYDHFRNHSEYRSAMHPIHNVPQHRRQSNESMATTTSVSSDEKNEGSVYDLTSSIDDWMTSIPHYQQHLSRKNTTEPVQQNQYEHLYQAQHQPYQVPSTMMPMSPRSDTDARSTRATQLATINDTNSNSTCDTIVENAFTILQPCDNIRPPNAAHLQEDALENIPLRSVKSEHAKVIVKDKIITGTYRLSEERPLNKKASFTIINELETPLRPARAQSPELKATGRISPFFGRGFKSSSNSSLASSPTKEFKNATATVQFDPSKPGSLDNLIEGGPSLIPRPIQPTGTDERRRSLTGSTETDKTQELIALGDEELPANALIRRASSGHTAAIVKSQTNNRLNQSTGNLAKKQPHGQPNSSQRGLLSVMGSSSASATSSTPSLIPKRQSLITDTDKPSDSRTGKSSNKLSDAKQTSAATRPLTKFGSSRSSRPLPTLSPIIGTPNKQSSNSRTSTAAPSPATSRKGSRTVALTGSLNNKLLVDSAKKVDRKPKIRVTPKADAVKKGPQKLSAKQATSDLSIRRGSNRKVSPMPLRTAKPNQKSTSSATSKTTPSNRFIRKPSIPTPLKKAFNLRDKSGTGQSIMRKDSTKSRTSSIKSKSQSSASSRKDVEKTKIDKSPTKEDTFNNDIKVKQMFLVKNQSEDNLRQKLMKRMSFRSEKKRNNSDGEDTSNTGRSRLDRMVPMTKNNIVSMTTAAIAAQPIQISTTVTNQLTSRGEPEGNAHRDENGGDGKDDHDSMAMPATILEQSQEILQNIQKTMNEATEEIQKTINDNLTDLKNLEDEMKSHPAMRRNESRRSLKQREKKIVEEPEKPKPMSTQKEPHQPQLPAQPSAQPPAQSSRVEPPIEVAVSIKPTEPLPAKPLPAAATTTAATVQPPSKVSTEPTMKPPLPDNAVHLDARNQLKKPPEMHVDAKQPNEAGSAQIISEKHTKPIDAIEKLKDDGHHTIEMMDIGKQDKSGKSNGDSGDNQTEAAHQQPVTLVDTDEQTLHQIGTPNEHAKEQRCCFCCCHLFGLLCTKVKNISCCHKCRRKKVSSTANEKPCCLGLCRCCASKATKHKQEEDFSTKIKRLASEEAGTTATNSSSTSSNRCSLCLQKMFCCFRSNKVDHMNRDSNSRGSDDDDVNAGGCCRRCWPCCRDKKQTASRLHEQQSVHSRSQVEPNQRGCCSRLCRSLMCCCKKKELESRRTSINSKKMSSAPLNADDKRKRIDESLVEHMSMMKGAIPVLPICPAWFCLFVNILVPGLGTILSGCFCLCFGIPRFSQRDGMRPRFGSFFINCIVGIAQAFTLLFCLVGWGWSIWWGYIMVKTSRKNRKLKKMAADAEKEEQFPNQPSAVAGMKVPAPPPPQPPPKSQPAPSQRDAEAARPS